MHAVKQKPASFCTFLQSWDSHLCFELNLKKESKIQYENKQQVGNFLQKNWS